MFLFPVDNFETALNIITKQADKNLIKTLGYDKPMDNALILVFENDGLHNRFNFGPMKKDEYRNWFESKELIEIENSLFYDIDYFTTKYEFKTFRYDKFVDTAYDLVNDKLKKLNSYLITEVI
jgi:hypothetical protein